MKYVAKNSKLYFLSVGLISCLVYLLNVTTAIYQCSLVFTLLVIAVNGLISIYNKTKTMQILFISVVLNLLLFWKLPYYIGGKVIGGLVLVSLTSVMISIYWSATAFQRLSSKHSVVVSVLLSLGVGAVIDGLIMSLFFIISNELSYERVLNIFIREISYKALYSLVVASIYVAACRIRYSSSRWLSS